MDQRKTVLLADAGEEFRTLLWEEMEKTVVRHGIPYYEDE